MTFSLRRLNPARWPADSAEPNSVFRMPDFITQALSNIWSIALIVLFFGGSIFVHELGHFLAARWRGLKVLRFSIGFGPKIVSWTRDGVEYRISWIPLGGYVSLPQLADMRGIEGGEDTDFRDLPPISYTSKMIVAVMGAVFNVLFAFLLACIIWVTGLPTTDQQETTEIGYVTPTITLPDGTEVPSPASQAGLRVGDRILAIDGKPISDWSSLQQTLVAGTGRDEQGRPRSVLLIERDGRQMEVEIFPRVSSEDRIRRIGILPAEPLIVGGTMENSPARLAGFQPGDVIRTVDGEPFRSRWALEQYIRAHGDREIVFGIERDGQPMEIRARPVEVQITRDGDKVPSMGFEYLIPERTVYPNPIEQIAENFTIMYRVLSGLLNPKSDLGISQMSGPPGIVRVLYATSQIDVRLVIWITIIININLAVFNLLPIPVLDGGHMLFATIAKIRGRPLPPRLIATTQSAFMILLFSLMLFVSFRDVGRWVRDSNQTSQYENTYIQPVFEKPASE